MILSEIDKSLVRGWRENANIPNYITDEQIIAAVNKHNLYCGTGQSDQENNDNFALLRQELGLNEQVLVIQLIQSQISIIRNGDYSEVEELVLTDILSQADESIQKWAIQKEMPKGIGMICSDCQNDTFQIYFSKLGSGAGCWEFQCTKCGNIDRAY